MRFFTLTVIFLLLSFSQTFAISPVNIDVIKEAQDYGKSNAQNQLKDFLLPWMSYEEKAIKLNETAERSYLYTSFLLIATDAREKNLLGSNVTALDSESILADYSGLLSFSTILFGGKQDFTQNANVVLKQAGKEIKVYQALIPSKAEKNTGESGQNTFIAQCYFYFLEKDIVPDIPIILQIKTNDKIEHSFYFDIAKIK